MSFIDEHTCEPQCQLYSVIVLFQEMSHTFLILIIQDNVRFTGFVTLFLVAALSGSRGNETHFYLMSCVHRGFTMADPQCEE